MTTDKTVAEFFAGIGLMRLGLERAGWQTIWANDIDEDKEAMYRYHFNGNNCHFILGDVHKLPKKSIPQIGLATASFPCTDLSLAGGRNGLAGSGSGAFWGFVKSLKNMGKQKPPLVLLENVVGFLTSHKGSDFQSACKALNDLGYDVDAFIVDAAHFVPQSRQRLFVIGSARRMNRQRKKIEQKDYESECRPSILADFILHHPELRWRIRKLPKFPAKAKKLHEIIEDLPSDSKYWWNRERCEYLLNQMSPRHREVADEMIYGEYISYGTVFRRMRKGRSMAELRTDGIAGCLRTPRGGSGRQILFVAGKRQYNVRLLTPQECAKLMGADDFDIDPKLPLNKALFGFGDAVCVNVVEWIARHYINPLWEEMPQAE